MKKFLLWLCAISAVLEIASLFWPITYGDYPFSDTDYGTLECGSLVFPKNMSYAACQRGHHKVSELLLALSPVGIIGILAAFAVAIGIIAFAFGGGGDVIHGSASRGLNGGWHFRFWK